MNNKKNLIIAVTGASGAIYAQSLINRLSIIKEQLADTAIVFSKNAKEIWEYELKNSDYKKLPFKQYDPYDFNAPFASGSAGFDTMIICPSSMGAMGRIAAGISNDLISRAADVMLKERKKLLIVPREMPYNLIHINNMKSLSEAGAIICPASPSFYGRPATIKDLAETLSDKILGLAGFEIDSFKWGSH